MRPKPHHTSGGGAAASAASPLLEFDSIDPIFHLLRFLPYGILLPPRLRLKLPSFVTLPSPMTVFHLVLLIYFAVVSGLVYDVIVEPPGLGAEQDHVTGAVRPVVFRSGQINSQYIIEGLSSGFMFVLGGVGLILMDVAFDRNRAHSGSLGSFGIAATVIAYVMSILFMRIKIPFYLS